jgi:hypothetical protein
MPSENDVEAVIALASWCRSLDEFVAKIAEQSASRRQTPENALRAGSRQATRLQQLPPPVGSYSY